jgi:hypothetical protein
MIKYIEGVLTGAGADAEDLDAAVVVITMSREALREMKALPWYKPVTVVPTGELAAMRKALEDIEHAGSAEWARKRAVRGLEGRP